MRRHVQFTGVRRWAGDDLTELQSEVFKVLDTFFAQYGNIIISGCEVEGDVIKPGIVGLYGLDSENNKIFKVVPFAGRDQDDSFPVYLKLDCETVQREYGDGQIKPVAYNYFAAWSNTVPENENYITINRTDNERFIFQVVKETIQTTEPNSSSTDTQITSAKRLWTMFGAALFTLKTTAKTIVAAINELYDAKQNNLNRTVSGNDNATGAVTDTGDNLNVPIPVTTTAGASNATQLAAGTNSLRVVVQRMLDNLANLFNRITAAENVKEDKSNKGIAGGYVPLDGNIKIPKVFLPDFLLGQLLYGGIVNIGTRVATLTDNGKAKLETSLVTITLTNDTAPITGFAANQGIFYLASTGGNLPGVAAPFEVGDWLVSTGSGWGKIDNTDAVVSVNGKTGAVTLSYSDVGAAPANASLTADTGTGTDLTTPAVASNATQSILQIIWAKIRQVANVANSKQGALNRTVAGNDNATGTVTDTGSNLSVPVPVTTAVGTSNATQLAAGTNSLRVVIQRILDNIANLFATKLPYYNSLFGGVSGSGVVNRDLGYYINSVATVTGIIKIALPVTWNNVMMSIELDIYQYSAEGASKIIIGGYNYSSPGWNNMSVQIVGTMSKAVRLAHDGTHCCILLGVATDVWAYPRIVVSKIITGYSGVTSLSGACSFTLLTSETGLTNIVTPTRKEILTIGAGAANAAAGNHAHAGVYEPAFFTLPVAKGGTGGTSAQTAVQNLFNNVNSNPGYFAVFNDQWVSSGYLAKASVLALIGGVAKAGDTLTGQLKLATLAGVSWIDSTGKSATGSSLHRPANPNNSSAASVLSFVDGAGNYHGIGNGLNNTGVIALWVRHTAAQIAAGTNAQPATLIGCDANGNVNIMGLYLSTGRNSVANQIVRTNGNGYLETGYINTSIPEESQATSSVFFEQANDGYIRKKSLANFKTELGIRTIDLASTTEQLTGEMFNGKPVYMRSFTSNAGLVSGGNLTVISDLSTYGINPRSYVAWIERPFILQYGPVPVGVSTAGVYISAADIRTAAGVITLLLGTNGSLNTVVLHNGQVASIDVGTLYFTIKYLKS